VNEDEGSIYVINRDGARRRRVLELASLPGGGQFPPNFTSRPAWSPSGRSFSSRRVMPRRAICTWSIWMGPDSCS
jgi:hypothetical protein